MNTVQRRAIGAERPAHRAKIVQLRSTAEGAVAQPWIPALVVAGAIALGYVGYRLVNRVRIQRLLNAIVSGQTNLRIDLSLLEGAELTPLAAGAERTRLLTDLALIAATPSGWGLLNAIAYPNLAHNANRVELCLWHQAGHNAEMAPQFPGGLSDVQKALRITTGQGVNCSFVVKAGEDQAPLGVNLVNNPFLPTPSDVVLYHELVHGYHFQNGTVDRTVITGGMAQHAVDIGLSASEYQATGLDAQGHHDFTQNPYTENRYRAELRALGRIDAAHRPHYRPV